MKFPKFVPCGFTTEAKQELVAVLEKTKQFVWDGSFGPKNRNREFICHAVEEVFEDDWDCCSFVTLYDVLRFIQLNIDASMNNPHKTFACWYETEHKKVCSYEPNYGEYIIGVQSHRKAWIDYLINNLKGN
jgi:hypothetical protein